MHIFIQQFTFGKRMLYFGWCLLALLMFFPYEATADYLTKSIKVTSAPAGSWICFKQRGAFQCDSQTPGLSKVDFYDKNEVNTLYIKKIGYKLFSYQITCETTSVNAVLERSDDLYKQLTNTSVAGKVKNAFNKHVFENNNSLIKNPYIDIAGPLQIIDIAGKDYLHIPLLAGINFSKNELKELYRLKNRDEFKSELVTKFINLFLKDLIKTVHYMNEKYSIGLEGVTVSISYPKNKSRLVDDEYQMTHTQIYTWESQTTRYTSITFWTENVVEMKVADEESYARIIFSLPLKESIVKHLNLDALQKHKDVVIMTNDNRANKLEVIVQ